MRNWALWSPIVAGGAVAAAWWLRGRLPGFRVTSASGPDRGRRPGAAPGARPATSRRRRPRPGDIWWADVPYADGTGSKARPCLVVRRTWRGAVVLKITSQDKSRRRDHLPIPTRAWDRHAKHDSWVNLAEPVVVPKRRFERPVGTCDPRLWRRIQDSSRTRSPARP